MSQAAKRFDRAIVIPAVFMSVVAAVLALLVGVASNRASADVLPDQASCINQDLARPIYFGGPMRVKKHTAISGSSINRFFQWNSKSQRWSGNHEWWFSYGFEGDDACAKAYTRVGWSKVRFSVQPRKPNLRRQWATGWQPLQTTLSEDSWYTKYGLWTGGSTRSVRAGNVGKIRRATVTVKLTLIRKADDEPVATRYHEAKMNVFDDVCFVTATPGEVLCAKRYPGYDQSGKIRVR